MTDCRDLGAAQHRQGCLVAEAGVAAQEPGRPRPWIDPVERGECLFESDQYAVGAKLPRRVPVASTTSSEREQASGAAPLVDRRAREVQQFGDPVGGERTTLGGEQPRPRRQPAQARVGKWILSPPVGQHVGILHGVEQRRVVAGRRPRLCERALAQRWHQLGERIKRPRQKRRPLGVGARAKHARGRFQ